MEVDDESYEAPADALDYSIWPPTARPGPAPTDYALRYGVPNRSYLIRKGKSGLTLIEPPHLSAPL